MDTHTLRRMRGDAMRDFEDGKLPEAEAGLTALICEAREPSDPWTAAELASCLQDRATVRRFSNRWREALDDLSNCERITTRLAPLPRQMMLPNVYYLRALLLSTPYSDIFDPSAAATAVAELRKYSVNWVADSLDAEVAFNQKEWDRSAALFLTLAETLHREGWMQGVASCRVRAAEALIEMHDWSPAEKELNASLLFLERSGPPDILANARLNMARIRAAQGHYDQAWDLALESLVGLESLVRHFRDIGEQQRFLANKLRFYDRAFEVAQMKAGSEGRWRAWSIAERAKSFYLCQLVANAEIPLFDGVNPDDIARLRNLESQLDEVERALSHLSPEDTRSTKAQELQNRVNSLSREKRDLLAGMMKQNPRWGALKMPPDFQIKSEMKKLDRAWIPISYFWMADSTDQQMMLHIFWTGSDRTPQTVAIPWTPRELATLDQLRILLRGTVSPAETTFPTELAAKVMPAQLLRQISGDSQLLISPHERLKSIPLHTVPISDDQLLIQKVPVQFIPTLTLLSLRSTAIPADSVLLMGSPSNGFGDSQLEEVETEISNLATIWNGKRPGRVRDYIIPPDQLPEEVGLDARHWGQFGILHFACHGVFQEGRPFDAALRLGRGSVRASELFSVRLGAARVLLSACSLGRQEDGPARQTAGDEWIGLYLPIFYSGAQQLLVSLYDADSVTTMKVMVEIHASISKGVDLARALQQAVKTVIDAGRPSALWANWYLVGIPA
jgi:hypothetical protein